MMLLLQLSISLSFIPFKPIICSAWNFSFLRISLYAMHGSGAAEREEKDLKYAKIISDNAHVRHSPRSCLKCQKLCAASPRGCISGTERMS